MVNYLAISDERIAEIKAETRKDHSLQSLSETILKGWPEEMANDDPNLIIAFFESKSLRFIIFFPLKPNEESIHM